MSVLRVSVVMAVFNGADHLAATIDSLLAQTEPDLEVVIVDDGSTDATPEILDTYASRDARIRILTGPNAGLTRALITGCAAARASYVARQDAGDVSHPERLATQCRMLDAPGVAFVSCATQYVGPEGEPLWIARPTGAAVEPQEVLDTRLPGALIDGPTHHGSVMFRRDAYERAGGYRAQFYYGQDFDLWYRLAELGAFQSSPEVLYTARITPDSISGVARREQAQLAALSRAALDARRHGRSEAAVLAAAAAVRPACRAPTSRLRAAGLYFVGEALRRNRDPRARSYLLRAMKTWPLSPRTWVRILQALLL